MAQKEKPIAGVINNTIQQIKLRFYYALFILQHPASDKLPRIPARFTHVNPPPSIPTCPIQALAFLHVVLHSCSCILGLLVLLRSAQPPCIHGVHGLHGLPLTPPPNPSLSQAMVHTSPITHAHAHAHAHTLTAGPHGKSR